MSSLNYSDFCRLCLVKERVSTPIFDGDGDVRRLFLKIATCLPIKVSREDHLPKSICDDCVYKVENQYQFWNTTANSEKQLHQWLGSTASDPLDVKNIHTSGMLTDQLDMKQESMDMDQGSELSKSLSRVEAVLAEEAGRAAAAARGEEDEEEEEESEEEGSNSEESEDDDNDADEPSKDDGESDDAYDEELEPTTFVNVSLACDEAGPSGTQQQTSVAPSTSTSAPAASGSIKKREKKPQLNSRDALKLENKSHPKLISFSKFPNKAELHKLVKSTCKPIHKCDICQKVFVSKVRLVAHAPVHAKTRPFSCDICQKTYKQKGHLNQHNKVVHNTEIERLKCGYCSYTTEAKPKLKLHTMRHLKQYAYYCDECNKGCYTSSELRIHKELHTGEIFPCEVCGKVFKNKYNCTVHQSMTHHPPDPTAHNCQLCGQAFPEERFLKMHVKRAHVDKNKYMCDMCGKSVSSRCSLRHHLRTHTGEKPITCGVCHKSFSRLQYLRAHEYVHTGQKPHACETCGKTYTQRSSLIVHLRYHTKEKPYKCDTCGKAFPSGSRLKDHQKRH